MVQCTFLVFRSVGDENHETFGFAKLPHLIFLDGGKGHVNAIKKVLNDLDINIPVFGMVKDKFHKTRTLTDEEVEIDISKEQTVFTFVYKIQEEVHRYSLARMDIQRRKTIKTLNITSIKGIGEAKAKKLFEHFSTVDNIKKATVEELTQVKGVTEKNAADIIEFFKNG